MVLSAVGSPIVVLAGIIALYGLCGLWFVVMLLVFRCLSRAREVCALQLLGRVAASDVVHR